MITLTVIYCMSLNPTMCRTLEVVPVDHQTVSAMECIKGGAIYEATSFRLDFTDWFVKGWRCTERPNIVQAWRRDRG